MTAGRGGKGRKMICPNCHAQIGEGCSFCPNCGFPLRQPEANAGLAQSAATSTESQPEAQDKGAAAPEGASPAPQGNPAFDGGAPAQGGTPLPQGQGPFVPGPAPKNHRKLTAIEIWVIIIGICALVALIISIVNAAHIETIKNALVEVIQNLQSMSN